MTSSLLLSVLLAVATPDLQEPRRIPDDSVEIETRGCLKGRVFTATSGPEDEGVTRGPDVLGRNFRVAGKKDVMDLVKKYDRQWVQIVGVVRKVDLADRVGMRVGGGRVGIGPGPDPTRGNPRAVTGGVPTMDVTSVTFLAERCPLQ